MYLGKGWPLLLGYDNPFSRILSLFFARQRAKLRAREEACACIKLTHFRPICELKTYPPDAKIFTLFLLSFTTTRAVSEILANIAPETEATKRAAP